MMLTATAVKDYLKTVFTDTAVYAGTIDKNNKQCIGVYPRGRKTPNMAIGGAKNSSYRYLPLTILVHWSESTKACEEKANSIYEHFLYADSVNIEGFRIIAFDLLDSCPVDLSRDDKNICEMVIRLNIAYSADITY